MIKTIDLHTHSTASDGTMRPAELIKYAKQKGLSAIALTDHDTIDGIGEAIEAGIHENIEVVPGIEINSLYNDLELHIVGLYIDYTNKELNDLCKLLRNEREKRNEKLINRLNEIGFNITLDEAIENARGQIIAKGHIIKVMIDKGYVRDEKEAREKYLYEGGLAYIKKAVISPHKCVEVIKNAGGIPILAHPGEFRISKEMLKELIINLNAEGIEGIETYYYSYDNQMTEYLEYISSEYKLIKSGGSDYHGALQHQTDIGIGRGDLNISYNVLEKIKQYLKR
jgi:predicted metal-dependent phosphoesterase TrpH